MAAIYAGQTCIPSSGIIKQLAVPWHSSTNNIISVKQTYTLRRCRDGRNIQAASAAKKIPTAKVSVASQDSVGQIHPGTGVNYNAENLQQQYAYLFRTEVGGLVKVLVLGINTVKYTVHIEVSSLPHYLNEHDLVLSWGMFRSDSSQLYAPDSQSSMLDTSQSRTQVRHAPIKTPFAKNSTGMHTVILEFNSTQIPFYLSFLLHSDSGYTGTDSGITSHRKTNFCVPVGISAGRPMPLGVSNSEDGSFNFALFCRNAVSVVLCLYSSNASQPSLEIELDSYVNRTGDIWHVAMESIGDYISYGYRCKAERIQHQSSKFHAHQVILDPYAKSIGNSFPHKGEPVTLDQHLGYLSEEPTFDWSDDVHPRLQLEKLVVFRLNVQNFTKDGSSGLPENVAGTFAGVVEKLQHLISLGVNAVLLEPIFSFDEQKGPYFPYHFFSPMNLLGHNCNGMTTGSMKEMVRALHACGIEVLLEVVFTHTSEGGDADCQTISFQGIDKSSYYITEGDLGSGISNAVNCNNPVVQQLILDSLHYWLTEFHIDGFCFINSSYLLRGSNGDYLSRPPLVEAIAFDPLLSKTKIIADLWSPVDKSVVDIRFPHWKRWAEINARFCRDVRNFLRSEGLLSDLATRLCGSGDLFSGSRGPSFCFNYVTRNSGLPLVDLVSFSGNELASELSWNCGEEGPTNKKAVLEIRLRQIRNFLFILFVSLGVPVLNMGDEFGLSAGGSSYSDRQPIDWNGQRTVFGKQITAFIAFLSSLRVRRSDIFQRRHYLKVENIDWQGSNQFQPKWEDSSCKFLAMKLRAEKGDKMASPDRGDLFICFNASDRPEMLVLPQLQKGYAWLLLVDTALPYPGFFSRDSEPMEPLLNYELRPHSCALFEAEKRDGLI